MSQLVRAFLVRKKSVWSVTGSLPFLLFSSLVSSSSRSLALSLSLSLSFGPAILTQKIYIDIAT